MSSTTAHITANAIANAAAPSSHPPMQAGWIEAPHGKLSLGSFVLESGAAIDDFSMSWAVHGDMQDESLPVAVALCAIGSVHHRLDFLIGPDRALDPRHFRIIAIDAIGNGLASSPSNSERQAGMLFPRFTIRDMVRSQKLLLDALGVREVEVVAGASMGGMQALQWGVEYPAVVRKIVALTPMAKTAPWAAAINEAARQSLLGRLSASNAGVQGTHPPDIWDGWVPIMQLLAMRTPSQLAGEFRDGPACLAWIRQRTAWWREQRFDPVDWIYQSWAYDAHDVGATPGFDGDTARALASIRARTLIAAPQLDLYNPAECASAAAKHIPQCELHQIESDWGHLMASSADEQAARALNEIIGRFLQS
ncbi:alpha/beta fold hydrolase [Lacisediminimonas profundi]|uniref:alpha/beta fold hydrolase n=1 Tax=Lacisediminimonas profundi TaxID=2603856 RepID=UPI001F501519|nr:alpha/beta fold hydrolase [Lacisediminimonas profundi]